MRRVLIGSSKGGSGKTTLTCNLAVALATRGQRVCIVDADPQGSAAAWVGARGEFRPSIEVYHSAGNGQAGTSGWSLRIAADLDWLLIDTPAGLRVHQLAEFLRRCDTLLVPIMPSAIDTRASGPFLADLAHAPQVKAGTLRVGLIGNRLKARTIAARELPEFTAEQAFPTVAQLRDSQAYVLAGALGRGVFDYQAPSLRECQLEWQRLLDWLLAGVAAPGPTSAQQLQPRAACETG